MFQPSASPFEVTDPSFVSIRFSFRLVKRRILAQSLMVLFAAGCGLEATMPAAAQTPVVLPNTVSTIAGNTPTASTSGSACPTNSQFTATDAGGDGCPAVNATFAGNEQSITVDPQGNVYITANSSNPQLVRRIDARTGVISIFADGTNSCGSGGVTVFGTHYSRTDKTGNNCPVYYTTGINGATGLGSDPYGNILITTTGDAVVNFVCTAVSPICTAAQARVNLMENVAGCSPSTSGYGTAVAGTTVGTAGDGGSATQFSGTCTNGVGAQQRGVTADAWDNIYFMDASNGRIRVVAGPSSATINGISVANPLYAALETDSAYTSVTQGYIYPMAGGGTVCAGKTDSYGDGCPFYQTLVNTSSTGTYVRGLAVDGQGDFVFDDGEGDLRVIYMGGTTILGALSANGITSPQIGYSYLLAGGGGSTGLYYNSSSNTGIYLGKNVTLQSNAIHNLAVDPGGNIYLGDQTQILFYDISTGYIRRLGGGSGAATCNSSSIGDGCPITQALFGAANLATPIGMDGAGNLYIQDLENKKTRIVSATLLPTTAVKGTQTSNLVVHAPVSGSTVSISAATAPDFSVGSSSCATNADNSVDCTAAVTYAPQTLAQRTEPVAIATVANSATTTQNISLSALSTGTAEVFDVNGTPSTSALGVSATGNTAVVLDGAGNAYVSGTQGISKISGSTVTNITANVPAYYAVDPAGAVYTAAASSTSITKYIYSAAGGSYTSSTISIPQIAINGTLTQAMSGPMVVDEFGVIYLLDMTNKQVLRFQPSTGISMQLTQTALVSPVAMTQDSYGQLVVIDGTSVYKIPPSGFFATTSSPVANTTTAFSPALVAPTAIAVDQGENIYVADSGNVIVHSLSGYQYDIPNVSGSGVAVDGAGNLYTASTSVAGITEVLRNAESFDFGTNITESYAGLFLNAGATASTGFNQTDTGGNYTAAAPSSPLAASGPTCVFGTTALTGGSLCNVSITFTPSGSGNGDTPDNISFLPSANTIGELALDGTKTGSNATTTTAINGNTTGLVYSTGTETTFTVTVTQSTGTPSGVVAVQFDGGTATNYTLTATSPGASTATATVSAAGLTATTHTIYAAYANQSGIVGSNSGNVSFSITQASTSSTFTPGTTSIAYSQPIGTAVLDAAGSSGGGSIPGVYVYTANGNEVNAATYLAQGTYTLAVTFYPSDSVDYSSSTANGGTLSVTQATTTAALGATQNLVASDGSGNFSSVQSALNALPSTGGSIYIKPGTYSGFVTVITPNTSLYGLGGNPGNVVITNENGAFSSPYPSGAGPGNNGSQGDQGSSTMVVARGAISGYDSGTTLTPYGFYAENLSIVNTYNTDTTTTSTNAVVSGTCTGGQAATPLATLYNNGTECNSQALAIWITGDQAVLNNVYTTSQQDTIYAGAISGGSSYPARQYWFRGKVTGDVDYIFGDAAAVFDHTSIYTTWHGNTATGTETIEAQNKAYETGSANDYLSGYIMNSAVFTSQSTGMTSLYLGRPYGTYSTWAMLNSYLDQVDPSTSGKGAGYIEFSGDNNLPTSTYVEYNDQAYTDPATGSPDANGVTYLGSGGNTGIGAIVNGSTVVREITSTNPGTTEVAAAGFQANYPLLPNTTLSQIEAQQYYPIAFLGKTVPTNPYNNGVNNWNPTTAIANGANAYVPSGSALSVSAGYSVTVLMRPQVPGLGAITNGSYTIPTGTYTLYDSFNSGSATVLASGSMDASGAAYFTSSSLAAGTHSLTWTYSGDSNFAGSTTSAPYVITVAGTANSTTTSLSTGGSITYGGAASVTATVSSGSGTPSGSVTLTIDGGATITQALSNGSTTFTVNGLTAGNHSFTASYAGGSGYAASSTSSSTPLTVGQASLTITGTCSNRIFGAPNSCSATVSGYQYSDSAATVFTAVPTGTTTAVRSSTAGNYTASVGTYTLSAFGSNNYTVSPQTSSFTISGGAPQVILFAALPNFAHGSSYQLTARTTSGVGVTYTVTNGSGIASVSGSTLTITGAGAVTIQASSATDPTGDYAAATPVSQSFTAQ